MDVKARIALFAIFMTSFSDAAMPRFLLNVPRSSILTKPFQSCISTTNIDQNATVFIYITNLYSYRSKTEARMQAVAEAEVDILGTKSKDLDHYCFIIRPTAKKRNLIKAFIQVFVKPKHFPGQLSKHLFTQSLRDGKAPAKEMLVFLDTDKPIYQPRQKVNIRLVTIDSDYKPIDGVIEKVEIINQRGSVVYRWTNQTTTSGLLDLSFVIDAEAKHGYWKVVATPKNVKRSRRFQVGDYVLSRFEMTMTIDKLRTPTKRFSPVSVCAFYTQGKPVIGRVNASACPTAYDQKHIPCQKHETKLENGCLKFNLNSTEIYIFEVKASVTETGTEIKKEQKKNFYMDDSYASFEEDSVLVYRENVQGQYKMIRAISHVEPGPAANEVVNAVLFDANNDSIIFLDSNLTTNWRGEIHVRIPMAATKAKRLKLLTKLLTIEGGSVELTAQLLAEFEERKRGELDEKEREKFLNARPSQIFVLKKWFSGSGNGLKLFPPMSKVDGKLECGITARIPIKFFQKRKSENANQENGHTVPTDGVTVGVTRGFVNQNLESNSSKDAHDTGTNAISTAATDSSTTATPSSHFSATSVKSTKMIYMLTGRNGAIIDSGIMFLTGAVGDEISFLVTSEMTPKLGIVAYFLDDDGGESDDDERDTVKKKHLGGAIISDSMVLDVEPCLSNRIEMTFDATDSNLPKGAEDTASASVLEPVMTKPGTNIRLHLKAAASSLCGVSVIDKSVTLLKDYQRFNTPAVFANNAWSRESKKLDRSYCQKFAVEESDNWKTAVTDYYEDASEDFWKVQLQTTTNLNLLNRPCQFNKRKGGFLWPIQDMFEKESAITMFGSSSSQSKSRSKFPETWIWSLVRTTSSGEGVVDLTVPDTVTEWVANAVCISPDKGIGITSEPARLIASLQFFVRPHLPLIVKRNEKIPLKAQLFYYDEEEDENKSPSCVNAELKLTFVSSEFKLMNENDAFKFCICGGESVTKQFKLLPTSLGDKEITIRARTAEGRGDCPSAAKMANNKYIDVVEKKIMVKAEGFLQESIKSRLHCSNASLPKASFKLPLIPEATSKDIVPDSTRGWIQVSGETMGPALDANNIGSLVRAPRGCGEQTMILLAPNVFVLRYMEGKSRRNDGKTAEQLIQKATYFIQEGFERELNYQHKDNSFSAFGERDPGGSTWLTAFVVKCFSLAQGYLPALSLDQLREIAEWLEEKQHSDGHFPEVGLVIHKEMQGGGDKDARLALTAFTLVSLIEESKLQFDHGATAVLKTPSILKAWRILSSVDIKSLTTYELTLIGYALARVQALTKKIKEKPSESPLEPHIAAMNPAWMLELMKRCQKGEEGDDNFWTNIAGQEEETADRFVDVRHEHEEELGGAFERKEIGQDWQKNGKRQENKAVTVEMTGYALMWLLSEEKKQVEVVVKTVAWLLKQMNGEGGFHSTQDTVVGLQALSEASAYLRSSEEGKTTVVIENTRTIMEINQQNRALLQKAPITKIPTSIEILVNYDGQERSCVLFQAVTRYNTYKPKMRIKNMNKDKEVIALEVDAIKYKKYNLDEFGNEIQDIDVCVGYNGQSVSGMILTEMNMVSGWKPNIQSLHDIDSSKMKRFEVDDEESRVSFYFDALDPKDSDTCWRFRASQQFKVEETKPASIRAFDYYEPDIEKSVSYQMGGNLPNGAATISSVINSVFTFSSSTFVFLPMPYFLNFVSF